MKRKKKLGALRAGSPRADGLLRALEYIRVTATHAACGRFPLGCTSAYQALERIALRALRAENAFRAMSARTASAPKQTWTRRTRRSPEET